MIHQAIKKADAGLHLKTAGTTWLEEIIGLAAAGGEGLAFAKSIYRDAYGRYDEMAKPYLTVIAIDVARSPSRLTWIRSVPGSMSRRSNTTRLQALQVSISARWCTSASGWPLKGCRSIWIC